MALPSALVAGQVPGVAWLNAILAEQTAWTANKNGGGYNLTNLGELHGAGATNILKFFTSGAEAARFDASGNLVFATGKYITQDAWTEPTLLNGWVPFIAATPARYRKDKQGKVHLSGFIKSGTFADGTTIFNLSAECTPTHGASLATKESGGGALARIELTAGSTAVKVHGLTANAWLMLDGLSFFLD